MDKKTAIKKISQKFSIPEEDIFKLLEGKGSPKTLKTPSFRKEKNISQPTGKNTRKEQKDPIKKYLFIMDDFVLLTKQLETISQEIKRIGAEIGDSTSDTKTFHDNFEYEELGRQQRMWTNRFHSLEKLKENVKIIKPEPSPNFISMGSKVKIEMENGEILTKKIGSYITFSSDDLSYDSPLAKLIIGKKVDDEIHEIVGNHLYSFKIKEVS